MRAAEPAVDCGGRAPPGVSFSLSGTVEVPGELVYDVTCRRREAGGRVGVRGAEARGRRRRIPYWGRVTVPALARHEPLELRRQGSHRGTTARRPALVTRYRYPDDPGGLGVTTFLRGPETVYRVRLTRAAKNFGSSSSRASRRETGRAVSSPASTRTASRAMRDSRCTTTRTSTAFNGLCWLRALSRARGRVRRRVRQRDPCRRRALHLSLLDRRRHPADVAATQQGGEARRSTSRSPPIPALGSTANRSAQRSTAAPRRRSRAGSFAFPPSAWRLAGIDFDCVSPTIRRRRTPRTWRASSEHAHADDHLHDPRALMESETQRPRSGRL